jgi:pimeloyl-ACP methyl ester carboxylesterase
MYLLAAAVVGAGFAYALPAVVPTAEASVTSALTWGACPQFAANVPVDPRQRCGTVRVPLDYRQPHGRSITVAVSRIPAADPAKRRGVLMLNPGGPGSEGLSQPSVFGARASKAVLDSYDLVGFDPRGVGRSSPVTCGLTDAETVPNYPYPAADGSIAGNVAFARSAAARCAARSGAVLPYITTANTARDIDLVRAALGAPRVSYWGGSYGTYLGAVYASMFPGRADRVVLDSAVDPAKLWYGVFRAQNAGMTIRFPDAARVAAAGGLGLGSTVDEVTAGYRRLASRLDRRPVTVPGAAVALNGNVLRHYTFTLLHYDSVLPDLARAWRATADLADGTATPEQVALLQAVMAAITPSTSTAPGVPADNSLAAAWAIACGDVRWPGDVRTYARNVAADRAAYPLTAGFGAGIWPCAFWPTTPAERPAVLGDRGSRNVLIVQNERDPATPLSAGRGLRRALGQRAVMVTVDAGGHGVYGVQAPGSCATAAVDAFLVGGVLPATDTRCPAP